jgi:hypothetical protein
MVRSSVAFGTAALFAVVLSAVSVPSALRLVVTLPDGGGAPLDGRMLVMLSTLEEGEPRFQIRDDVGTQQIFGVDVEGAAPGQEVVVE